VKHTIVATTPSGIKQALERYAAKGLRVAVEAGGHTAWIHDVLVELGAKVHVVHPVKVKWIAESKKKTDRVDAELLAHLLRIGGLPQPVHMPGRRSRELRALLGARRQLVRTRTKLINVVRGLLRQQRVTVRTRGLTAAPAWRELSTAALSPALREIVTAYGATVAATTTALEALDGELATRARGDGRVTQLQSIPGVGQVSAQTLIATVDRIERFAGQSGVAPSCRTSQDRPLEGAALDRSDHPQGERCRLLLRVRSRLLPVPPTYSSDRLTRPAARIRDGAHRRVAPPPPCPGSVAAHSATRVRL